MARIQNNISIEGDNVSADILSFVNDITAYEQRVNIHLSADGELLIQPNGFGYIKGLVIKSENELVLHNGDDPIGKGSVLFIDGIDAPFLRLSNAGVVKDRNKITDVDIANRQLLVESRDIRYTHSKLIGTEADGPFASLRYTYYRFTIDGHTTVTVQVGDYETTDQNGDPLPESTIASNFAAALEDAINTELNVESISVVYNDTLKRFEITATKAGPIVMGFDHVNGQTTELYMGMYDPTLILGTEYYKGYKLMILDGDQAGSSFAIDEIDGEAITVTEAIDEALIGSNYKIIAPSEAVIDMVLYQ